MPCLPTPDAAAQGAAATIDSARATANYSVSRVGRTLLFLIPAVALVAGILGGYFRGARVKVGGVLLIALLIIDLLPFDRAWVVTISYRR